MHRHHKDVTAAGVALDQAQKAMIMIHGRGAAPPNILEVAQYLQVEGFALLAPRATANTWYPHSFMAPVPDNEPGLSTGLGVINQIVEDVLAAGIAKENIYFLGFSQGACLTSEYIARNAARYGGAFIYSGGVIGANIDKRNYQGNFEGTPILIGCSDVDGHIPLHRVKDSTAIFTEMGAQVTERIYPNGPHAILENEITLTNEILLAVAS